MADVALDEMNQARLALNNTCEKGIKEQTKAIYQRFHPSSKCEYANQYIFSN